jgi:outer membrane receptor protein involved in Fe transport
LEAYAGVENILNYMQMNPIVDASNPFGEYFDASMVWGPAMGRNIYVGLRYSRK